MKIRFVDFVDSRNRLQNYSRYIHSSATAIALRFNLYMDAVMSSPIREILMTKLEKYVFLNVEFA